MAFVDKIIGPDEKLVGISTIHWMYAAIGIIWMVGFLVFGIYLDSWGYAPKFYFPGNPGAIATSMMGHAAFWICALLGVVLFLLYFMMMMTTEIGLTSKRIIYKRGWLFVTVNEADLEEVKAAGVNNGIFGRFLNYGYIELDARFIKNMNIPAIADPYRFVKAVNEIRSNLKSDSMTIVLAGNGDTKVVDQEAQPQPESQSKPQEKVHKLDDPRYEAISNNPARNMQDVSQETQETAERIKEQQASQTVKIAPHPATPPPESWTKGEGQPQASAPPAVTQPVSVQKTAEQPPAQPAPQQNPGNQTPGPIVFEKENLKEELKEDILEDFSDGAKKRIA